LPFSFLAALLAAVTIAQTTHPENRFAAQKPASGIFFDFAVEARPATLPQTLGTHLESATYVYKTAPGCAVDPNSVAGADSTARSNGANSQITPSAQLQRRGFLTIDAAGAAASREARALTKKGGNKYEWGGEIYSYRNANGVLEYGYVIPRQGAGIITFVDADGVPRMMNQGPPLRVNAAEGVVVGYYHSHHTSGDFSTGYSGGNTGDRLVVVESGRPLYLGRESMVPFSSNTVVRVMEYNDKNVIIKRTIGSYKWPYE